MVAAVGFSNGADALQSGLVADVTAERVARIGGVDDDPATSQYLDCLPDEATLGRYRMKLQIYAHVSKAMIPA